MIIFVTSCARPGRTTRPMNGTAVFVLCSFPLSGGGLHRFARLHDNDRRSLLNLCVFYSHKIPMFSHFDPKISQIAR